MVCGTHRARPFGRERAHRPEHEEHIDFHAGASHFPGKSERSEEPVEGIVADNDGEAPERLRRGFGEPICKSGFGSHGCVDGEMWKFI